LTTKIDLELRKRIVKAKVWSVALYGDETWTMTDTVWSVALYGAWLKIIGRRHFDIWIWKKTCKISWTQKVINQDVLNTIHEERSMINNIHL